MTTFWDKYYQKPLNEIPWQNAQADWFEELINKKIITGNSALDLGCGTGKKSVYLAKNVGFKKVIGVDISKKAIEYANLNAKENNVESICSFVSSDLREWSFLKDDEEFDFILDWALIHCLSLDEIKGYLKKVEKHCRVGGKFLVRFFTHDNLEENYFEEEVDGVKAKVSLFTEDEIKECLPGFRVIARNKSFSGKSKIDPGLHFKELLMEKK